MTYGSSYGSRCPQCGHITTGYEEDIKALGLLTAMAAFASVVLGAMSAYLHFDWMPAVSSIVCFVLNALVLIYGVTTIICFIFVIWSIGSHCREHRLIAHRIGSY